MTLFRSAAISIALIAGAVAAAPRPAQAYVAIGVSVGFAPPPLPIYDQPPIPGPGYLWTPGYWDWDDVAYDYYWIPGTWILPPEPGLYWTPAWWGWNDGVYLFHAGYWGPEVGFYGGVVYGFGYEGVGYDGGYWQGGRWFYNRSVNNLGAARITGVFDRPVSLVRRNSASFNGPGGVMARATPRELAAQRARHIAPTPLQVRNMRAAQAERALHASVNHGAPSLAATARPAAFSGPGVVHATRAGGAWRPPTTAQARQMQAQAEHGRGPGRPGSVAPGSVAMAGHAPAREQARVREQAGGATALAERGRPPGREGAGGSPGRMASSEARQGSRIEPGRRPEPPAAYSFRSGRSAERSAGPERAPGPEPFAGPERGGPERGGPAAMDRRGPPAGQPQPGAAGGPHEAPGPERRREHPPG